AWCDLEVNKTDASMSNKVEKMDALQAKIDKADAAIVELANEIKAHNEMVEKITVHMKESVEIRKVGKQENALAIKDAQQAQTAIADAVAVLEAYYKESGMLPKEPYELAQTGAGAPAELGDEPSTWDASYTGVTDPAEAGEGVVAVLKSVSADFAKMEADSRARHECQAALPRARARGLRAACLRDRGLEGNAGGDSAAAGTSRYTLRFADPRKEEGFANTHKAQLSRNGACAMAAFTVSILMSLAVHRFWDDSQYPTREALKLSRWQLLVHVVILVSFLISVGSGRLLAKHGMVSTLGLEITVVSACVFAMVCFTVNPKHYMARVFGYSDTEAIWGVDLGATDCSLVLAVDLAVTCVHLLIPIRWVVLVPLEVAAVLCYIVPSLLLGSPVMTQVPFNIIAIVALVVISAIGKRASERQIESSDAASKEKDPGSELGGSTRPGTTPSAAAFDGSVEHASLDQIRAIGQREQWLIASGEVQLLTDMVLGSGGFGVVVAGLYHNNVVAVKAPKEDIVSKGAVGSSLPELCNELRTLRRLRHPNIVFLYGACMDAALRKLCLVLEFVDGVHLGVFIRGPKAPAEPRPGAPQARDLAGGASVRPMLIFDILSALRYLHSREPVVVHGDLKDANVFVEARCSMSGRKSYRAKLLDFGLSRILTRRAKPLGGTLRWMAPELTARQAVPPDCAADCYSFGLLTYFIVTRCFPFEGSHADQLMRQLRRGQPLSLAWPTPADELTRACRSVVEQCTRATPAARPTTQQVSDELSTLLSASADGAAEAAADTPCTRRPSIGGKKLPGASVPTAADASAARALQQFAGVVEARQPGHASVSSLTSDMGFGSLPPVKEHKVMLTGEAADSIASPPPRSPSNSQGQLAHPEYEPTPLSTQALTLALLISQWNQTVPRSACCRLHGALRSLDVVREEVSRRPCRMPPESLFCGQCGYCGLLKYGPSPCEFCGHPGAPGAGEGPPDRPAASSAV
ncbi:unnamed protein product, partial [Prorocentrum cordatum]